MNSNKSKKCVLSSSNFNELMDLPQVISNLNLNQQFWRSLKDTMNTRKESPSIKGRIFTAKRILTPIIQELMKDALEQLEFEEEDEVLTGKEVKVLYNNLKAKDVWHVQTDVKNDGEEWAAKILREISRDLEQPFVKLREEADGNEIGERTSKDTLLSKNLLAKLVAIHQHLGNIIGRLKQRCKPKTNVEDTDSLNNVENRKLDIETNTSNDTGCSTLDKTRELSHVTCNVDSFSLHRQNVGYVTQSKCLYEKCSSREETRNIIKVENACSPIDFEKPVKADYAMSRKLLYDVAVSYHALFEENKNNSGNKEIVIKCLEDLEKVRTYLEALRDNKDCEKPKFSDLESCKNGACIESQPHLHSNLHKMPMVLKLNKHAEENERTSDLIIGIPSLTKSSPDVHILLNTKDEKPTEQVDRTQNQYKNQNRVSRIPKPIEKQRIDVGKFVKSNSMRITLENRECVRKNPANLLIFDPDDPSKSIIKMKEQKSEELDIDTKSLVSSTRFILSHQENLMLHIICCIGGKKVKLKVNINIWLVFKSFLFGTESLAIPLCFSVMKLRLSVISFSLAAAEPRIENRLIFEGTAIDFYCSIEWNTRRSAPRPIKFNHDFYLENYMDRLFNFIPFIKNNKKKPSSYQNSYEQKSFNLLNNFNVCQPNVQQVYFFHYFKSHKTKKKNAPTSSKKWNYHSQNAAAYPIWTIKRSKYYSVPQSKTKEQETLEGQVEETEEPLKMPEVDSLENATGSHNEIHMQISEVSVRSNKSRDKGVLETESDKLKTEIKRKVSFRDEVDISGSGVDSQDLEPPNCNVLPVPTEGHQSYVDIQKALVKSTSSSSQKNLRKLSSRISDLLMTDSLMQIANEISKQDKEKLKLAVKKSSPKDLDLTDSAKTVLAKLSKSFGDEEYTSASGTLESDLVPQFFDEKGNPIAEVFDKHGELLFSLKDDSIGDLASVLFDSEGSPLKNRYDVHGNRIKVIYDDNGRTIKSISLVNDEIKGVQADLETVEYYDHRGKPIRHLYDSSGYEIKTVGNDLTSRIFDPDGRIRMEIYTRKGRKIDAVYDSRGRLLAKVSDSQLVTCGRREQVRVAKMDAESLSKLFECGSKSEDPKSENENSVKKSESPKRFYDQDGNPLIGVYDKKGRPMKLTSSGEADELLPFLFDNKGKLQSKRYDSKGKELKAVFGEDGKVISGMSIAWLNELLAGSENEKATSKKKGSFFKKVNKTKKTSHKDKRYDIEKLYDSNGKILTSIFDSKGKPLAISLSGDATKLLPSLFDNGGKFIKRRYDSEKKKIRCVYGREGNVISAISVTYLNRVTEKLKSEQNEEETAKEPVIESKKNWSCPRVTEETVGSMMTVTKATKSFDRVDKTPMQLYDKDGNLLTDILDEEGNVLETSASGDAWKLIPHLFDENGKFVRKLYDKKGNELSAVYNEEGKNLSECLTAAMKITTEAEGLESLETGKDNEMSEKECNNNLQEEEKFEENAKIEQHPKKESFDEHKHNKTKKRKKSKQKNSSIDLVKKVSSAGSNQLNTIENMSKQAELTTVEQEPEKKQLKPTTSITKKQSVNQSIDIPEEAIKAGDSIYRFFDQRGNQITEVYDHKGRALIRTKSGDVEQLAKYVFDKKGFLYGDIYDRKGRRITKIFDQKKRSISRISVPSIISDERLSNKHRRSKGISGCIYDNKGNLIKEIYDRKGNLLVITRLAKFKDLAPIIFDDKGVRRRIYDKTGYEIGPVFDYKGKLLKNFPAYKKPKRKIYSISGKPLRNFYDSDGSLIIALYNDYGKTLCSVKKDANNVELLSKFFFDKEGHFLKGRFYNYRGEMIRHVYDSDSNIVRSIKRTESRRIAHHKCSNYEGDKLSQRKNAGSANKLNIKINFASKHKQRGYHGKSEVRPVENITGTFSQSDTVLNPGKPLMQRSMSAYSIRDYPVQQEGADSPSSSASSLADMSVKKFYDEHGRLLTGVYNSKTRLLGYSASGNARVLAPYLFDMKGNFISGRYNLDRKPLRHIYDSNGKLVDKMSKHDLDNTKEHQKRDFQFHERNGDVVTSVYNLRDDKTLKAKDSFDKASKSVEKKGKPKKKLYNRRGSKMKTNEDEEIVAKPSSVEFIPVQESVSHEEKEEKVEKVRPESKGRFSILSSFKDKFLTVIFDNQNRISQKLSLKTFSRPPKTKREKPQEPQKPKEDVYPKKNTAEMRAKLKRTNLYDKNLNMINKIYDDRRKAIKKLYNSDGKVVAELYSASGTLVKNNVLKNMFENNVFKPKAFNSEGNIITAIYANEKQVKKVFDDKGEPAKEDSDLIYLVSDLSLPKEDVPSTSKAVTKQQVNYFSEGSSYPFPEGQKQKSQVENQQLIEEQKYETELKVAFNGYARRTDNCTCEQCQQMHKRKDIVQFGGNLMNGLSRFTAPLSKFISRSFSRREYSDVSIDSLETLIDKVGKQDTALEDEVSDPEYYGSCSRVLLESDENVPISRNMIEKTLRKCVHLNSSTDTVGKVSDTVIQHFANLILQQIEQKFYHKLDILQCGGNPSKDDIHAFQYEGENDICIGTELKFEDSLIGRHTSAQTPNAKLKDMEMYGYFNAVEQDGKAFVCKMPNLQPFIMMMKANKESFDDTIRDS